jgi:hypothetical protein
VLSELKVYADEWPEVVNLIQSVPNILFRRSEHEDAHASLHWTRGDDPSELLLKDNVPVNVPLDFIKAEKLVYVEKLSKTMTEIHTQAAQRDTRDRIAAIQKHNDKMF